MWTAPALTLASPGAVPPTLVCVGGVVVPAPLRTLYSPLPRTPLAGGLDKGTTGYWPLPSPRLCAGRRFISAVTVLDFGGLLRV